MSRRYIKVDLKNLVSINKIVTMDYFELEPSFRSKEESHDFWEMIYVDGGAIVANIDGAHYELESGELIFYKPNQTHFMEANDDAQPSNMFIICFECKSSSMQCFVGKKIGVPVDLRAMIEDIIEEGSRNFAISTQPLCSIPEAPLGGLQMIKIKMEMFLIYLMRNENQKNSKTSLFVSKQNFENNLVSDMVAFLDENLCGAVTLEQLERNFHFGKSHLCKIFKENTGDTIIYYHNKMKIAKAKELLLQSDMSVADISEMLGFESSQYFSRVFKKLNGTTPSEYRAKTIRRLKAK